MEYKGFVIGTAHGSLKRVHPKGRGSSPKELRGIFTSGREAQLAIDKLERNRGAKRGKDKSGS